MAASSLYVNHQLDPTTNSIRLLELVDTGPVAIACRFRVASLELCVPYFALSYTWGAEDDGHMIDIEGHRFLVRKNLWDFLLQTRNRRKWYGHETSQDRELLLWIDAVCIDQGNVAERNHQVEMMGNIYKQVGVFTTRYKNGCVLT